jgi:hypothetical protein
MLGEQCIVRIGKDVPRMTSWYFREEVVGVSYEKWWFVLGQLGME